VIKLVFSALHRVWFFLLVAVSINTLSAQPTIQAPRPRDGESAVPCNPKLTWSIGGTNLIVNGGFETSLSPAWHASPFWSRFTKANSLEGTNCLALVSPSTSTAEVYQEVQCPSACDYITLSWAYYLDADAGVVNSSAFLKVELRDTNGNSLAQVADIRPEPNPNDVWHYRSVDLSRWRGLKVRLVFQGSAGTNLTWVPWLDNIRVEAGGTESTMFHLFTGTSSNLSEMVYLGATSLPSWNLNRLSPESTNYWRVDTLLNETTNIGPVWSFAVGPTGSLDHLSASQIPDGVRTNETVRVEITAEDYYNNLTPSYNGAGTIKAFSDWMVAPRVVISEVVGDNQDGIEFFNPGEMTNDVSGWQVFVYDGTNATSPRFGLTLPTGTLMQPGGLFVVRETGLGGPPVTVPEFPCPTIDWKTNGTIAAGVVLLDSTSNIVDCALIGARKSTDIQVPVPLKLGDWRGVSASVGFVGTFWGCQRIGNQDTGLARDWTAGSRRLGMRNGQLQTPFCFGFGEVPVITNMPIELKAGHWSGEIRFGAVASNAWLTVSAPGVLEHRSQAFDIAGKPLLFVVATSLEEGTVNSTNSVKLRLQRPALADTVVELSPSPNGLILLPSKATIPAGELEIAIPATAFDDQLLQGTQLVVIQAVADGLECVSGTLMVNDNERAVFSITAPTELSEGQTNVVRVHVDRAPDAELVLQVDASPAARLSWPARVSLPAGKADVEFALSALQNGRVNGLSTGNIHVAYGNWAAATSTFVLLDNEPTNLVLTLPDSIAEGGGTLTNGAKVALGGFAAEDVLIKLGCSDTNALTIPTTLTIQAGQTTAFFPLTAPDNQVSTGSLSVWLTATSIGFGEGKGKITVQEDDPETLVFEPVVRPSFTGEPVTNTVHAFDHAGQPIKMGGFEATLYLAHNGVTNLLFPLQITNGQGKFTVSLQPTMDASFIVTYRGITGQSDTFNVLQPAIRKFNSPVRDVAWLSSEQVLLATTVGSPGQGEILAINISDGSFSTWANVPGGISSTGLFSGGLMLTPSGDELLVVGGEGEVLQLWDVHTKALTGSYTLPQGEVATDMAVAQQPLQVLLCTQRTGARDWTENAILLDRQLIPLQVPPASFLGSVYAHINTPATFYGLKPYVLQEWLTDSSGVISQRDFEGMDYLEGPMSLTSLEGRLFSRAGAVHDLTSSKTVGTLPLPNPGYPGTRRGIIYGDETRGQVLFAAPASSETVRVQSFGAFDLQPRREILLPGVGLPRRMVLCGSNCLALLAGTNLSLVAWPVSPSGTTNINLAVHPALLTDNPRIGVACEWCCVITNTGPADATDVQLRYPLPGGMLLQSGTNPGGSIWTNSGAVLARITKLPAGKQVKISLSLVPSVGGWTTNLFVVDANEEETETLNNRTSITSFIAPSGAPDGAELMRLAVRSLVLDDSRKRVYGLSRDSGATTALYSLDLESLKPKLLRSLPGVVVKLRLSKDCHFLYAAVNSGNAFLVIDLTGSEPDLLFDGFPPEPGYENTLLDFAINPADSRTIVAGVTSKNPEAYYSFIKIGTFNQGVLQAPSISFSEAYGSWATFTARLELDDDSPTGLFARYTGEGEIDRLLILPQGLQISGHYRNRGMPAGFFLKDGKSYTGAAQELLAESGRFLRSWGERDYGLVSHDPVRDRIWYLPDVTYPSHVSVYDRLSFAKIDSLSFVATGPVEELCLLDPGRALIATVDGRLLLVRSSALNSSSESDLSITMNIDHPVVRLNEDITIDILITNRGPAAAAAAGIACQLPSDFLVTSTTPPGQEFGSYYRMPWLWTNQSIPAGTQREFKVTGHFVKAGLMQVGAGASDRNWEPQPSDNWVARQVPVVYDLGLSQMATLSMPITDAVYDPVTDRILATVNGDGELSGLLITLDPHNGSVLAHAMVGPQPGELSIQVPGRTLYVAVDGGAEIAQVNLDTLLVDRVFPAQPAPQDPCCPVHAVEMTVDPGDATQVVAWKSDGMLALYREGNLLTEIPAGRHGITFYAPGQFATISEAKLHRYRVAGTNFVLEATGGIVGYEDKPWSGAGLILMTSGFLIQPETLQVIGKFPAYGAPMLDERSRVVIYSVASSQMGLTAFDLDTQQVVAHEEIGQTRVMNRKLFSAGHNLLAGFDSIGEFGIIRTGLLPERGIDTDKDGMPDGWESSHNLMVTKADADEDSDGDGVNNLLEYLSDTDPCSNSSCPRLVVSRKAEGGGRLVFPCRAGVRFRVETTHDLASEPWAPVVQSISFGGFQTQDIQDPKGSTYFRVRFGP
jgi:uncharacterized repeat protein (TIGR01451 family)